jgi:hypothetical protein
MAEMTWQCHPDVELPSYVTVEAHETLYAPRGWQAVRIDLDKAAGQFYRPVTEPSDLSASEVKTYCEARDAEAAEKAKSKARSSKSDQSDSKES